jgi:hypothetical protein
MPQARRETQPGLSPGKASQRRLRPFWPQPFGNEWRAATRRFAIGKASSLAVAVRLDWRLLSLIRVSINSVNTP